MSYRLSISRRVNKRLEKLLVEVYDRVDGAIFARQRSSTTGPYKAQRSRRLANEGRNYRIVYGIDAERRVVEILNVAHRRDVYRQG